MYQLVIVSIPHVDDVTVYSSTIHDLQFLIKMCADYAQNWRFNFGIKKTKCTDRQNTDRIFIFKIP